LYNDSLLHSTINLDGGDIGFVDDYLAWVTGKSVEENTPKKQDGIISRVIKWEGEIEWGDF
jgi:hypothetical protein